MNLPISSKRILIVEDEPAIADTLIYVLANSGFSAGALLAGLFASLYVLLESEDNALVLGSLLMFVLLGIAMLTTRKLDWYGLGQTAGAGENSRPAAL
ncbi:inner membrane CreD family protein [Methylomonas sp. LL1]|uniref:inner membrane CreD family protein n=1 Tax=Methylomonas sp. LL1 TaxID=2785785 RepID=UPI0018C3A431|nr:inner membrane CreD family protein [Methylomonas sp. LL1]